MNLIAVAESHTVKRCGLAFLTLIVAYFSGCRVADEDLSADLAHAHDALYKIEEEGRQSYGADFSTVCSPDGRNNYSRIAFCLRGGAGTIVAIDDTKLKNLKGLKGIVGLDLSETRVSDAGLAAIEGLVDLEYLQLAKTVVTDRGLTHLVALRHLQALDLVDTHVTQEGSKSLARLPRLKVVYARGTTLVSVRSGVHVDKQYQSTPWIHEPDVDPLKSVVDVRER